jgi:hypothetical protein
VVEVVDQRLLAYPGHLEYQPVEELLMLLVEAVAVTLFYERCNDALMA